MAKREFDAQPEQVRGARRFAANAALGWGVESRDLETVVGELAANAYRHAGTPFSVSVCYVGSVLAVEVADRSSLVPVVRADEHPHAIASGRGLVMVEALAKQWGARPTPAGKVVWAELPAVRLGSHRRAERCGPEG